jgi:hypothetical protein
MPKAIKLNSASGRKIKVIMQNIMGNIQKHYPKTIASKEIGGWSWRNQSELTPVLISVSSVFVEIEKSRTKRQHDVGCRS